MTNTTRFQEILKLFQKNNDINREIKFLVHKIILEWLLTGKITESRIITSHQCSTQNIYNFSNNLLSNLNSKIPENYT